MNNTKTIYIRNSDVFYGLTKFLEIARDDHKKRNNENKRRKANEYLEFITPQRPLEPGGFNLDVPTDIDKFAEDAYMGVDDYMWETLDADAEMRGDVEKGYRLLTNI